MQQENLHLIKERLKIIINGMKSYIDNRKSIETVVERKAKCLKYIPLNQNKTILANHTKLNTVEWLEIVQLETLLQKR